MRWQIPQTNTVLAMPSLQAFPLLTDPHSYSGMAKVSDSRGGSSYKDLGLSLGGGSSYKEINPVPEAARNRI